MTSYKKIVCILLSLAIALSFVACSPSTCEIYKYNADKQKVVSPEKSDAKYRTVKKDNLELICSSGLIELYLDKQTYAVVIKETSLKNYWYALPTENVDGASVISLNASKGDTLYKLNSQDNSVAFGTAKYEKKKNGVWVNYTLSEKKNKPKISLPITVKYTLKDGSLNVDVNCKKLKQDKSLKVETVELLKYLGATKSAQDGDFMLVPDGCGAKINTAIETDKKNYNLKVYGRDYAVTDKNTNTAIVPAFGAKSGTGAFGAIIKKGDALSTINATKADKGGYNTVGATFAITPTQASTDEKEQTKAVANDSYTGDLSICYRFLSGKNATYSGVAAVCREQLIRDAVLSTKTVKKTGTYPVNVTLIGDAKNGTFDKPKSTTFEQVENVTELLKAKGINSLNLCYSGALSDGIGQSNLKDANVANKLGSKSELEELRNYMTTQEFGFFLDINMLTMTGGSLSSNITNDKITVDIKNNLHKYFGPKLFVRNLIKSSDIEDNVVSFMADTKNSSFSGYCVNDAGSILYSDFSDNNFVSREKNKKIIAEQVRTLSTNRKTMAKSGNFYMLKNVDYILDIPMNTNYKQSDSYESIPFVQMILHGIIEYSGKPINLEDNYEKAFLKNIEYGTALSYEMSYDDIVAEDKSTLHYEKWIPKVIEGYNKFNNLFADLRDARITDHYVVKDGLTCTVYNNMTYVYVNYSSKDITHNNLVIKANNYLRVN